MLDFNSRNELIKNAASMDLVASGYGKAQGLAIDDQGVAYTHSTERNEIYAIELTSGKVSSIKYNFDVTSNTLPSIAFLYGAFYISIHSPKDGESGLIYLHPTSGTVIKVFTSPKNSNIQGVEPDGKGNILFILNTGQLYRYNMSQGAATLLAEVSSEVLTGLTVDEKGNVYVMAGDTAYIVWVLDEENNNLNEIYRSEKPADDIRWGLLLSPSDDEVNYFSCSYYDGLIVDYKSTGEDYTIVSAITDMNYSWLKNIKPWNGKLYTTSQAGAIWCSPFPT